MAATQSKTGRSGNVTVGGNVLNITGWTAKPRKEFADSTDSGDYDATTGQTWTSQAPGVTGLDGTIKGNWDFGGSTDTNLIQIFKSDGPYAVVLKLTASVSFASFNADITDVDVEVSVPGSTMISFTANFKSNGIITYP